MHMRIDGRTHVMEQDIADPNFVKACMIGSNGTVGGPCRGSRTNGQLQGFGQIRGYRYGSSAGIQQELNGVTVNRTGGHIMALPILRQNDLVRAGFRACPQGMLIGVFLFAQPAIKIYRQETEQDDPGSGDHAGAQPIGYPLSMDLPFGDR